VRNAGAFTCELYCPADALYVAPQAEAAAAISEQAVIASGPLGSYREAGADPAKNGDHIPAVRTALSPREEMAQRLLVRRVILNRRPE
jgi:hypothetical protein